MGVFLNIAHYKLVVIKNDQSIECLREMLATWLRGTDASPAALVRALRSAGMVVLARKLAVKYGEKNLCTMHDLNYNVTIGVPAVFNIESRAFEVNK